MSNSVGSQVRAFSKDELQKLLEILAAQGYEIVGPRLGEGAVVYDTLTSLDELPKGWTEEQDAGTYRLKRDKEERYFGYTVGPHSWKKYLHPPHLCLFRTKKQGTSFSIDDQDIVVKRAFLGVRACELAAIAVQDNVFLGQEFRDPWYQRRRAATLIIGVNCSRAAATCFCVSTETGPEINGGDDLTLTELPELFLARTRTERGRDLLAQLDTRPATEAELSLGNGQVEATRAQMGRQLKTEGLPELLKGAMNHSRWEEVADRCLSCTNCTMVCPTCFCFTVDEVTDLTGQESQRVRQWDSCFTTEFTYTSGTSHRKSTLSRYRHWMTHKLATWHDQFGESGCVGCGRCISWCPVGIDITEEAAAIRANPEDKQ